MLVLPPATLIPMLFSVIKLLIKSNSPPVWLTATSQPDKVVLNILDLPPLTMTPPLVTVELAMLVLATIVK